MNKWLYTLKLIVLVSLTFNYEISMANPIIINSLGTSAKNEKCEKGSQLIMQRFGESFLGFKVDVNLKNMSEYINKNIYLMLKACSAIGENCTTAVETDGDSPLTNFISLSELGCAIGYFNATVLKFTIQEKVRDYSPYTLSLNKYIPLGEVSFRLMNISSDGEEVNFKVDSINVSPLTLEIIPITSD